jgi:vancomycin resistance protein YoaR
MPALQMLKDWNMSRGRIEIQTDDMAIPDYNLEQKNRVEFVTALGQLLSQAHPMMEMMPGSMPFVLGILQWVCAGFKGGRNVEGLIDKAIREAQKMPKEKDDGEAKAKEAEMQMKQAELQGKLKIMEAQLKVIMQKAQIEQQKGQQDLQLNQQKGEQDLKLTEAKGEVDIENTELKTEADIEAIEDKTEATVASILRKAKAQSEVSANKKV